MIAARISESSEPSLRFDAILSLVWDFYRLAQSITVTAANTVVSSDQVLPEYCCLGLGLVLIMALAPARGFRSEGVGMSDALFAAGRVPLAGIRTIALAALLA